MSPWSLVSAWIAWLAAKRLVSHAVVLLLLSLDCLLLGYICLLLYL